MAGLKDSPDLDGKRFPAGIALVNTYAGASPAHFTNTLGSLAARACRAMQPDTSFYKLVGRFFVMKIWFGENTHVRFPA